MTILEKYITAFGDRRDLEGSDAEAFLDALIDEANEPLLADVFRSWNEKGISEDEVYYIARILRERCTPVRTISL